MKKLLLPLCAMLLLASCNKADFDFRGSGEIESGKSLYMKRMVEYYFTDHLRLMEKAFFIDGLGVTGKNIESFQTDPHSIWETGAVWKAGEAVPALRGATIEKTSEDSTWVVKRDADALLWLHSFPTRSEVVLRMRPTEEGAPNHEWDLSVVSFERTEDKGYKAVVHTDEPAEFRVAYSRDAWGSCKGKFWMTVSHNGKEIDHAILSYNGSTETAVFVNAL